MTRRPILDPTTLEGQALAVPLFDAEAIRRANPQRFEMEQLTSVVLLDPGRRLVVGHRDVNADEFWARGVASGGGPLPGSLICEAAAQLCSFYFAAVGGPPGLGLLAFGGMDGVRFRRVVRPNDRLVLVGRAEAIGRRRASFVAQGFVGSTLTFHARILGIVLPATGPA